MEVLPQDGAEAKADLDGDFALFCCGIAKKERSIKFKKILFNVGLVAESEADGVEDLGAVGIAAKRHFEEHKRGGAVKRLGPVRLDHKILGDAVAAAGIFQRNFNAVARTDFFAHPPTPGDHLSAVRRFNGAAAIGLRTDGA